MICENVINDSQTLVICDGRYNIYYHSQRYKMVKQAQALKNFGSITLRNNEVIAILIIWFIQELYVKFQNTLTKNQTTKKQSTAQLITMLVSGLYGDIIMQDGAIINLVVTGIINCLTLLFTIIIIIIINKNAQHKSYYQCLKIYLIYIILIIAPLCSGNTKFYIDANKYASLFQIYFEFDYKYNLIIKYLILSTSGIFIILILIGIVKILLCLSIDDFSIHGIQIIQGKLFLIQLLLRCVLFISYQEVETSHFCLYFISHILLIIALVCLPICQNIKINSISVMMSVCSFLYNTIVFIQSIQNFSNSLLIFFTILIVIMSIISCALVYERHRKIIEQSLRILISRKNECKLKQLCDMEIEHVYIEPWYIICFINLKKVLLTPFYLVEALIVASHSQFLLKLIYKCKTKLSSQIEIDDKYKKSNTAYIVQNKKFKDFSDKIIIENFQQQMRQRYNFESVIKQQAENKQQMLQISYISSNDFAIVVIFIIQQYKTFLEREFIEKNDSALQSEIIDIPSIKYLEQLSIAKFPRNSSINVIYAIVLATYLHDYKQAEMQLVFQQQIIITDSFKNQLLHNKLILRDIFGSGYYQQEQFDINNLKQKQQSQSYYSQKILSKIQNSISQKKNDIIINNLDELWNILDDEYIQLFDYQIEKEFDIESVFLFIKNYNKFKHQIQILKQNMNSKMFYYMYKYTFMKYYQLEEDIYLNKQYLNIQKKVSSRTMLNKKNKYIILNYYEPDIHQTKILFNTQPKVITMSQNNFNTYSQNTPINMPSSDNDSNQCIFGPDLNLQQQAIIQHQISTQNPKIITKLINNQLFTLFLIIMVLLITIVIFMSCQIQTDWYNVSSFELNTVINKVKLHSVVQQSFSLFQLIQNQYIKTLPLPINLLLNRLSTSLKQSIEQENSVSGPILASIQTSNGNTIFNYQQIYNIVNTYLSSIANQYPVHIKKLYQKMGNIVPLFQLQILIPIKNIIDNKMNSLIILQHIAFIVFVVNTLLCIFSNLLKKQLSLLNFLFTKLPLEIRVNIIEFYQYLKQEKIRYKNIYQDNIYQYFEQLISNIKQKQITEPPKQSTTQFIEDINIENSFTQDADDKQLAQIVRQQNNNIVKSKNQSVLRIVLKIFLLILFLISSILTILCVIDYQLLINDNEQKKTDILNTNAEFISLLNEHEKYFIARNYINNNDSRILNMYLEIKQNLSLDQKYDKIKKALQYTIEYNTYELMSVLSMTFNMLTEIDQLSDWAICKSNSKCTNHEEIYNKIEFIFLNQSQCEMPQITDSPQQIIQGCYVKHILQQILEKSSFVGDNFFQKIQIQTSVKKLYVLSKMYKSMLNKNIIDPVDVGNHNDYQFLNYQKYSNSIPQNTRQMEQIDWDYAIKYMYNQTSSQNSQNFINELKNESFQKTTEFQEICNNTKKYIVINVFIVVTTTVIFVVNFYHDFNISLILILLTTIVSLFSLQYVRNEYDQRDLQVNQIKSLAIFSIKIYKLVQYINSLLQNQNLIYGKDISDNQFKEIQNILNNTMFDLYQYYGVYQFGTDLHAVSLNDIYDDFMKKNEYQLDNQAYLSIQLIAQTYQLNEHILIYNFSFNDTYMSTKHNYLDNIKQNQFLENFVSISTLIQQFIKLNWKIIASLTIKSTLPSDLQNNHFYKPIKYLQDLLKTNKSYVNQINNSMLTPQLQEISPSDYQYNEIRIQGLLFEADDTVIKSNMNLMFTSYEYTKFLDSLLSKQYQLVLTSLQESNIKQKMATKQYLLICDFGFIMILLLQIIVYCCIYNVINSSVKYHFVEKYNYSGNQNYKMKFKRFSKQKYLQIIKCVVFSCTMIQLSSIYHQQLELTNFNEYFVQAMNTKYTFQNLRGTYLCTQAPNKECMYKYSFDQLGSVLKKQILQIINNNNDNVKNRTLIGTFSQSLINHDTTDEYFSSRDNFAQQSNIVSNTAQKLFLDSFQTNIINIAQSNVNIDHLNSAIILWTLNATNFKQDRQIQVQNLLNTIYKLQSFNNFSDYKKAVTILQLQQSYIKWEALILNEIIKMQNYSQFAMIIFIIEIVVFILIYAIQLIFIQCDFKKAALLKAILLRIPTQQMYELPIEYIDLK